jgi:hypothetical protein
MNIFGERSFTQMHNILEPYFSQASVNNIAVFTWFFMLKL